MRWFDGVEGATEMATTEVDTGEDPDAVQMSRSIVSSQNAEIARMRDMLTRMESRVVTAAAGPLPDRGGAASSS